MLGNPDDIPDGVELTDLGKVLMDFRIEKKLTLKDMAESLGLKPSQLSSYENGRSEPTNQLFWDIFFTFDMNDDMIQRLHNAIPDRTPWRNNETKV